jgi:hypothetical protein
MRSIVHVGLAKAASTYLQDTVFPRLAGVALPFGDPEGARLLGAIALQDQLQFDEARVAEEVRRRLGAIATEDKIAVMSSEGLSLIGGCDRRVRTQRVKRLFPDSEILFVIRRQDDLIRSYYGGAANLGLNNFGMRRFPDINDWLELAPMFAPVRFVQNMHPLEAAAFHETLREYVDVFGRERVHVVVFEEFKHEKLAFAAALGAVLEQPEDNVLACLHDEPKRHIVVDGKVMHKVSFSPLQKKKNSRFLFNRYTQRLIREIVPRLRPRLRTDFNEKWTRRMAEAYGEANRRLAQEFDLPLARHGYPGCEGESTAAEPEPPTAAVQAGD